MDRRIACQGKRRFESWVEAQKVARWQARRHTGERFEPYKCRSCHGIHVGERGGKDQRRPRARAERRRRWQDDAL